MLLGALSKTSLPRLNAASGVLRCRNGDNQGRFVELGPLTLLPVAGVSFASEHAAAPLEKRLHGSSTVTGSFAGLQIRRSLCPLGLSNSSKGFLVLHIFCSLSSQALNCFPLGTACIQGWPEPWMLPLTCFGS